MRGKAHRDSPVLVPTGECDWMITKLVYIRKTFKFQ